MSDNNIPETTINTRDLPASWYVLHVINGKEIEVMNTINSLITSNNFDNKQHLITSGYIDYSFRLHDYILDIGFPREFDLIKNKQCQAYNTYVFIELDVIHGNSIYTGQQIFDAVFLPLLQKIEGVKDFVGTYYKVQGVRRTEIIRMNKREKLSRKQVEKVKPSKLPDKDYLNIERSHSSFSYYEEKLFNIGDICWFVPNLDKPHNRHLVKITKQLSYDKFMVCNQLGHKYAVSVNNLWLSGSEFVPQDKTNLVIASKIKPTRHKLPVLTTLNTRETERKLRESNVVNIRQLITSSTDITHQFNIG